MTQKISDYIGSLVDITDTLPGTAAPGKFVIASSVGTIIPSDLILTPVAISPLTGTGSVSQSTALSAAPYNRVFGETRSVRRFQVQTTGGDWSAPTYNATINADTSAAISPALAANTGYEWRCRDETTDGKFSDWSIVQSFSTGAASIQTPTISVEGQDLSVPEGPILTASAFTVIGGTNTHVSTDWEVRKTSDNSLVYSSIGNTTNKTTITVPKGFLLANTQYKFRVRYNGSSLVSSYGEKIANTLAQFDFGKYLAVSFESVSDPINLNIYGQSGDTFTKLNQISAYPPTGSTRSVAFSYNGLYLAVVGNTSFITIYKRSGDAFSKLIDISTSASGGNYGVEFSPDGTYLVVSGSVSPYTTIFKRSGDTFTNIGSPFTPQVSGTFNSGNNVKFSPDGLYLAIAGNAIQIYRRNGDSFASVITTAQTCHSVSISTDSTYFAFFTTSTSTTNQIVMFKRSISDTFSLLPQLTTISGKTYYGGSFSPDGTYLAVNSNGISSNTDILTMYKRSGDAFIRIPNPTYQPPVNSSSFADRCMFSGDGLYLALSSSSAPFLTIYKRSGDMFTKLPDPSGVTQINTNGIAFYPRVN